MMHRNQLTDGDVARRFMLAGKAKFTMVSEKTGVRFTYKVSAPKDGGVNRFVSVLNGPDNWDNYKYLGFIDAGGQFRAGRKGLPDAPSFRAFHWVWHKLEAGRFPAHLQVWHEGACGRCGRPLTVPTSIATGFGPTCAELLGVAWVDPLDEEYTEDFIPDEDGEQALMRKLETDEQQARETEEEAAIEEAAGLSIEQNCGGPRELRGEPEEGDDLPEWLQ